MPDKGAIMEKMDRVVEDARIKLTGFYDLDKVLIDPMNSLYASLDKSHNIKQIYILKNEGKKEILTPDMKTYEDRLDKATKNINKIKDKLSGFNEKVSYYKENILPALIEGFEFVKDEHGHMPEVLRKDVFNDIINSDFIGSNRFLQMHEMRTMDLDYLRATTEPFTKKYKARKIEKEYGEEIAHVGSLFDEEDTERYDIDTDEEPEEKLETSSDNHISTESLEIKERLNEIILTGMATDDYEKIADSDIDFLLENKNLVEYTEYYAANILRKKYEKTKDKKYIIKAKEIIESPTYKSLPEDGSLKFMVYDDFNRIKKDVDKEHNSFDNNQSKFFMLNTEENDTTKETKTATTEYDEKYLAKIIEETNEPKTEEKDVDVIDKKIEQKPLEEMPSYRVYDSKLEFPETVIDLDLNQMPAEKSEVLDKNKILFYMTKNIDGNPHHGAVFA